MPDTLFELDGFLRRSKLPTLPAVAVRLMELMTQDVSFPVVAKLLMTDASLSVEVLRAANSPLFGTDTVVTVLSIQYCRLVQIDHMAE